jgi:hypothetical protein
MAGSEWTRELELLEDPRTQAWLESAANRMVGELWSRGRFDLRPADVAPESDSQFADRLIRRELGLIADGLYPISVVLRVALLRAAHEVVQTAASIRALPESAACASQTAPIGTGRRTPRRPSVRKTRNGAAPREG